VELLRPTGANDRRGDPGLLEHPGHTRGSQIPAAALAEAFQGGDRLKLGRVPVTVAVELARAAQGEARPGLRVRVAAVLAGQEAAGQRVINDHADSLVAAKRHDLRLDLAVEHIVARLNAVIP